LAGNDELYYYLGSISEESYNDPEFLTEFDYGENGLRRLMLEKNRGTFEEIQDLKIKLKHLEIEEQEFYDMWKVIQDKALKETKIAPTILIKPTELSTYKNLVDVLDEMLVCNIGFYAIVELDDGDRHLLYTKTGNPEYLTEEKRSQLDNK